MKVAPKDVVGPSMRSAVQPAVTTKEKRNAGALDQRPTPLGRWLWKRSRSAARAVLARLNVCGRSTEIGLDAAREGTQRGDSCQGYQNHKQYVLREVLSLLFAPQSG